MCLYANLNVYINLMNIIWLDFLYSSKNGNSLAQRINNRSERVLLHNVLVYL